MHSVTVAHKLSLWGYTGDIKSPFLKISLTDYKHLGRVKCALVKIFDQKPIEVDPRCHNVSFSC